MDINITLLGQLITFAVFVWFTMRFVWPPLLKTMKEREQHIAAGLAAAEQGQRALEAARQEADEYVQCAKQQAAEIVESANRRASQIAEESKRQLREENERLCSMAKEDIQKEWQAAQQKLHNEAAGLALAMAEKVLARSLDASSQHALLKRSLEEI